MNKAQVPLRIPDRKEVGKRFVPYPSYSSVNCFWLSKAPSHWKTDRLKWSITACQNGVWGDEPDGDNDIPCVRVADFDRTTFRVYGRVPTLMRDCTRHRIERTLRRGDLLLEKSGGGELQPVGAVVLYDADDEAVCSNFIGKCG